MKGAKLPSRMSPAEMLEFKRRWEGTFLAIHIDGGFAYGRVVRDGFLACYDLRSTAVLSVADIEHTPVFLTIPLKKDYYLTAGWQVLGRKLLEPPLDRPVRFFREDPITGDVDIYIEGDFVPYAGEDLSKMQRLAVWHAEHVVSRLEHHFFGKPDRYPDEPLMLEKYRNSG